MSRKSSRRDFMQTTALAGADSLYSTEQMPQGIPVATVAIGKAGAANAGILATQILALSDAGLSAQLKAFKAELAFKVEEKDAALQAKGLKPSPRADRPVRPTGNDARSTGCRPVRRYDNMTRCCPP